ncbi:6801_t:CDS:2, partial [Gigaspora margarita]
MFKKLYTNRSSWAQTYILFQFNADIQSTQSIESFNNIIKKFLNSSSTLCELEEEMNKKHEQKSRYCKLVDIKAQYTTIGLLHISSQFFSTVDNVLISFLTLHILFSQRFQVSHSFTYKGQKEHVISEVCFIYVLKNVVDEPQVTLKAILDYNRTSNIIEIWRIPIESSMNTTIQMNLIIQSLRNFQGSNYYTSIQKVTSQKNRYEVAFSIAKTTINIALETKSDDKL